MKYKDRQVTSVGDLLQAIKAHVKPGAVVWYRGHTNKDWGLVPSLARDNGIHLHKENALYKRFVQNATQLLENAPDFDDEWGWLFLMQHHRAPTRLLDWSESPLVALYFATLTGEQDAKDSAIWCLDPIELNRKAKLNFAFDLELPAFKEKKLQSYLPSYIDPKSPMDPVAAIGPRSSRRMAAQLGTFTVNHTSHEPIQSLGDKSHVWRYIIPAGKKASLRRELLCLGYSSLMLFPDLDQVAGLLAREYLG